MLLPESFVFASSIKIDFLEKRVDKQYIGLLARAKTHPIPKGIARIIRVCFKNKLQSKRSANQRRPVEKHSGET